MTVCGRRGKPKTGFPRASTVLGNRKSRDSHIPTAAARRGKVENQKQVSHFPTRYFFFPKTNQKGGLAADRFAPAPRLILGLENASWRAPFVARLKVHGLHLNPAALLAKGARGCENPVFLAKLQSNRRASTDREKWGCYRHRGKPSTVGHHAKNQVGRLELRTLPAHRINPRHPEILTKSVCKLQRLPDRQRRELLSSYTVRNCKRPGFWFHSVYDQVRRLNIGIHSG
jgi:hypothetical protein